MAHPDQPILDTEAIAALARQHLPAGYVLLGVRMSFTDNSSFMPRALEFKVEYENRSDDPLAVDPASIEAHQRWADGLVARIRREWPKEAVRINFSERACE